jgi:polygalacturonase
MNTFQQVKKQVQQVSSSFDVSDFGAEGNGTTDDTQAINKAITEAHKTGGGTVFFPKGTYKCLAVRPKSKVTLRGLGWGLSVLRGFNDGSDYGIVDGTGYFTEDNPLTEFNMFDLELDGAKMNRSGYSYGRKGIGNQWIKNSIFQNVYVHDVPATAIGTDFTIDVYFLNCLVERCGTPGEVGNGIGSNGFGIGVNEKTEAVEFTNCQALKIANNGFTLEAQSSQGIGYALIANCYAEKCGNAGYSNSGSQRVSISGCIDNASKWGVYISANAGRSADQTIITGCEFKGQKSHGVYSDQSENKQTEVKGCMFSGCGGAGIHTLGSYCSFTDNTFKDCKKQAILCSPAPGAVGRGYLFSDNLILNCGSGIEVDSRHQALIGLLIKGNLIQDCKGTAIKIICKPRVSTGDLAAALIEGNVCVGNPEPQIKVVGSSKNLVINNNLQAPEEL